MKLHRVLRREIGTWLPVLLLMVFSLFPFVWMGITSFKTNQAIYNFKNPFVVNPPTLEHYHKLLIETKFLMWMLNSFLVGAGATMLSVVAGTAAGYALSKLRIPGGPTVGRAILVSYLVPRSLLFIPLYTQLRHLGLMDTRWGLILTYSSFIAPFCTWLLSGYFDTVPNEVEECAFVDGATRLKVLFAIDIPMVRTGMVTAVIFAFTLSWQEFIYALTFIQSSFKETLPVGMGIFKKGDVFYWGELMAGGLLASVPIAIFYIFVHRRMVEGMTAGAVKG